MCILPRVVTICFVNVCIVICTKIGLNLFTTVAVIIKLPNCLHLMSDNPWPRPAHIIRFLKAIIVQTFLRGWSYI